MEFELRHNEGILTAIVNIDGVDYEEDVTKYFEDEEITREWLYFRRMRRLAESRK